MAGREITADLRVCGSAELPVLTEPSFSLTSDRLVIAVTDLQDSFKAKDTFLPSSPFHNFSHFFTWLIQDTLFCNQEGKVQPINCYLSPIHRSALPALCPLDPNTPAFTCRGLFWTDPVNISSREVSHGRDSKIFILPLSCWALAHLHLLVIQPPERCRKCQWWSQRETVPCAFKESLVIGTLAIASFCFPFASNYCLAGVNCKLFWTTSLSSVQK